MPVIHWFRRDLRLHDNAALAAAARASGGAVIPLFILDDRLLRSARVSAARVVFLLDALRVLDAALHERGSRLVVRHGAPAEVLAQIVGASGATAVFFNRDYTPFARQRDAEAADAIAACGAEAQTFKDLVIWEPDDLLSKSAKPYTVYTPYRRQWRARIEAERAALLAPVPPPPLAPVPEQIESHAIPTAADLGHHSAQALWPGGEAEGLKRLQAFVRLSNPDGVRDYHVQRDFMARPATSRLSAYLHLGCVATVTCLRAGLDALDEADDHARAGVEGWLGELAWHDFYMQILYHFPHVLRGAFKPQYDALEWDNSTAHFAAWCAGRTGYPVVDAAMRQLSREGWMHNRARMIVGSFLVKDLLIDWRWGEQYFLQQLVDGDHAANNGGWQWIAGTGTDAQPYFRIFNPTSQSERFDPQSDYIRRYVPELANVAPKYIHAPWTMPAEEQRRVGLTLERDYPAPIVDHRIQRERTLHAYKQIRMKNEAHA